MFVFGAVQWLWTVAKGGGCLGAAGWQCGSRSQPAHCHTIKIATGMIFATYAYYIIILYV